MYLIPRDRIFRYSIKSIDYAKLNSCVSVFCTTVKLCNPKLLYVA